MAYAAAVVFVSSLLTVTLWGAEAMFPVVQYPLERWRVMNCRLGVEDWGDCESETYWITVLVHAAPGVIVAGVVAIVIPFYLFFKYVWNCCGGRKQSPNFCCSLVGQPGKYSKPDLLRPVILAVAVFGLCVVACIWGFSAQRRLSIHLNAIHNAVEDGVQNVETKEKQLLEGLIMTVLYSARKDVMYNVSLLTAGADGEDFLNETSKPSIEVSRMLSETIVELFSLQEKYAWVPYVLFPITTLVSFVGMICALCNYRRYVSMSLLWIMTVLAIVVWGCNGLYAASSFYVREGCFEVSEFTHRRENVVKALAKCNDTDFERYISVPEALLKEQAQLVCQEIKLYCRHKDRLPNENAAEKRVLDCPPYMSCSEVTDMSLIGWTRDIFCTQSHILPSLRKDNVSFLKEGFKCVSTDGRGCDMRECLRAYDTDGLSGDVDKDIKTALYAVNGVAGVRSTLDTIGTQLGSCDAIFAHVVPSLNSFCNGASDATYDLMQSTGLLGVALIVSLFTYGMGAKRFIPFKQALLPQDD